MKRKTGNTIPRRILALIMAVLMVVLTTPVSTGYVSAATTEHPSCVTITVVDTDSNPIQDATVAYTIVEDSAVSTGTFTEKNGSETTDEYGVVEVLSAADYVPNLQISAVVSKGGYDTDSTTIAGASIESDGKNFVVKLNPTTPPPLKDIENVEITVLNSDYIQGTKQPLITSVSTDTEDVTVEYSTDGTNWSGDIPEGEDAGTYTVYVKISKTGYTDYVSEAQTAVISPIDIPDLDIEGCTNLKYQENAEHESVSQELVELSGTFEDTDTVTWTVNDADTGSREIPTADAVGAYTVTLKVTRSKNYIDFEKTVSAEISNAELDLTGLQVKGLNGTYNGEPQNAVTVEGKGDYSLKYQLADAENQTIDENAWEDDIPKVTNAGSYIVWVKAVKANYDDKTIETPYNAYIAKAEQNFQFEETVYHTESSSDDVTAAELLDGKTYNFKAVDSKKLAGGTISYEVDDGGTGIASLDTEIEGKLTVTGAGTITVKAVLTGNDNYKECVIQHKLKVNAIKDGDGQYVYFDNAAIEYVVGNKKGIPANSAQKKFSGDNGGITYHIENANDLGLSIDSNTGTVSVNNFVTLIAAVENSAAGSVDVTVSAVKAEDKDSEGGVKYPGDQTSYTLKITLRNLPENAYSIYDVNDLKTPLTVENGENGWYKTAVAIKPASGYSIIRSDKLTEGSLVFSDSVTFGENNGTEALDQGIDTNRAVYLRHSETGEITKKAVLPVEKLDSVKPYGIEIIFPDVQKVGEVKYYNDTITVTFVAYDMTSGVESFNWEYRRENKDNISESILDFDSGSVEASLDPKDKNKTKYTGTLKLPSKAAQQLRGNLKVSATDKAGNTCDSYTDTGVFVVDTVPPQWEITYGLKNQEGTEQTVGDTHYFSNDVVFTFSITEANFTAADVWINIFKDGGVGQRQTLTWNKTKTADEYRATLTLAEEGEYAVTMAYQDASGNKMDFTDASGKTTDYYESETIVIDKTKPVIDFEYRDWDDATAPQTATVTITEHNFRASDIALAVVAQDITGQDVTVEDFEKYLQRADTWTSEGDVHTAVISDEFADAIYNLVFSYQDLAKNEAEENNLAPDTFIVDRTAPDTDRMEIAYSTPLAETVLGVVTFGYYNPTVTITLTGHDDTSGIAFFTVNYTRDSAASEINAEDFSLEKVEAKQDSTDKTKFTAEVILPREEAEQIQLRGSIAFTATDCCGNGSDEIDDSNHIIVVDTITPTLTVKYTKPYKTDNGKNYYNESLTATITVTEANFYEEDVKVSLQKDGGEAKPIELTWPASDSPSDVHMGTFVIEALENHENDGEYVFLITYTDRSKNEITDYTSDSKVMDTVEPVVAFEYNDHNADLAQTAVLTITEHNFSTASRVDIGVDIEAKDINGSLSEKELKKRKNDLNIYLRDKQHWTSKGDVHTIEISNDQLDLDDAIYNLMFTYTDLAGNTSVCTTDEFTVDWTAPDGLNIDYSNPKNIDEKEEYFYYRNYVKITFTAYDDTSGVKSFTWSYQKEEDASDINVEEYGETTVDAERDTTDRTKFTATIRLPKEKEEQLRGNIAFKATDNCGNESDWHDGYNTVIVVDTIAPTMEVKYTGANNSTDGKHYYHKSLTAKFKVTEANFYEEDVKVRLKKNDEKAKLIKAEELKWTVSEKSSDVHIGTYTIEVDTEEHTMDGDYVFSVNYTDRSTNKMADYTSDIMVIDTVKPKIEFKYKDYTAKENPQSATVTIKEHNFRASDIELAVDAKDITGQNVTVEDFEEYLQQADKWTSEGDIHTAVIGDEFADAIYHLTINYKDLALNKAKGVENTFIVDRTAPDESKMSIAYSTPVFDAILSTVTFGYYNPTVAILFTGYDDTSGIDYFTWNYKKEGSASSVNVLEYADTQVMAVQDGKDQSKFTAAITLPQQTTEQLRGNIAFTATDKCNNVSGNLKDDNYVVVVDTIAPVMSVEYTAPDNVVGDKSYYTKSLTATFTITEANFYTEDVEIKLQKDDDEAVDIIPTWTDTSPDEHVGTYTIEAKSNHSNDADYVFLVAYKDRSNNEMIRYISDKKVIDTTIPVISVEYSNNSPVNTIIDAEGHQRKYYNSANTATVTITEHNFDSEEVHFSVTAKDVAGNAMNAESFYTKSAWSEKEDAHIINITYPGDANYTFDVEYTDLAKLAAEDHAEEYFTVDTSKPADLSVTYSESILDAVLSTVTFGFYQGKASVTIRAKDDISGIGLMKYSYVVADGVSNVNASLVDAEVGVSGIQFSEGGAIGTVVFEIPRNALEASNQFNGTINFMAADQANNESDYLRDTKRIIVDSIAPTANVEYNAPVQQVNGISYYDGDINATVTINEANFYEEDVHITVTKNNAANPVNAVWTSNGTDVHIGSFTISGDGDYLVKITYSDKSSNGMQEYTSGQMTIDTEIAEASITINGVDADGKAFKDDVVLEVSFEDRNYESYQLNLVRTSFADKNVDVTEKFMADGITTVETGGSGTFDTFDKIAENDGIYIATVELSDKAGHTVKKSAKFTVNRYGSVYEYSDYLVSMIANGGAYVQKVDNDFAITEYNADRLVSGSLDIEISRDGRPAENNKYTVTPEINETVTTGDSGWFQYTYTISKDNFMSDGVYKIAVSSKDSTGNSPENSNYEDKNILFRVDSSKPELTSVVGLEEGIVNATEQIVKYTVYDTIGLGSVAAYVNGKEVNFITDFSGDPNNYSGTFTLKEKAGAQQVRIVATDKAGNVTDTDADSFESSYVFHPNITVSTNIFVRWYADKPLFFGSMGGTAVVTVGGIEAVFLFRRKRAVH